MEEEKTQPGHQHQNRNNNQTNTQNQNQNQNRRRNNAKPEGPKREAILDLNKYKDQKIRVKFMGGRQITGVLTGFDQLMNLVLEDVEEKVSATEERQASTRSFKRVVVRGPSLLTLGPLDGSEEIDNPFLQE